MSENAVDNHLWGDPARGDGFSSLPSPALCSYRAKAQTLPTPELPTYTHPRSAVLPHTSPAGLQQCGHHHPNPTPFTPAPAQHDVSHHSSGLQRFSTRGRVLPAVSRQAVTRVTVLCSPQVPPVAAEAGCCESC